MASIFYRSLIHLTLDAFVYRISYSIVWFYLKFGYA